MSFETAPANIHELRAAEDFLEGVKGCALGDRNYWSPVLSAQLREGGLEMPALSKKASREPTLGRRRTITSLRYRIETVFGQLCERSSGLITDLLVDSYA